MGTSSIAVARRLRFNDSRDFDSEAATAITLSYGKMSKMISLHHIHVSSPLIFRNLAISPLLTPRACDADYFMLDEALSTGKAHITELSEIGSVPELRLHNETGRPILLLDGEELTGAKQNRICNLTLLAPGYGETIVPVSCVEEGRWYWRSQAFATTGNVFFAEGRARKAYDVSESLEKDGAPRTRQDAIWDDISGKLDRLRARSSTAAMSDAFAQSKTEVDRFVAALQLPPQAVGALFSLNGRPVSLEFFESPVLCTKLCPKLIRSWAIDAIEYSNEEAQSNGPTQDRIAEFMAAVTATPTKRYPAVGLGETFRFLGTEIAGGALVFEGRLLHVAAFSLKLRAHARQDCSQPTEHRRSSRESG